MKKLEQRLPTSKVVCPQKAEAVRTNYCVYHLRACPYPDATQCNYYYQLIKKEVKQNVF